MSVTLSKAKLLCMEKHRNNKLSSTLEALKQINKVPTLSERLKVAGIKECKPAPPEEKKNDMNRPKKRNYYKKLYLEKATSKTFKSTSKTKRNVRNLTKDYLLPYVNESTPNEDYRGETPTKNYTGFPEQMDPNIQANTKETIFVSLDFLQDCQNYKRSIRKTKFTNSRFQKKKKTPKRRCLNKKRESVRVKRVPLTPVKQGPSSDVERKSHPAKALEEKVMEAKISGATPSIILRVAEEQRAAVSYGFNFPFETEFLKFQEKVSQDSIGKIDKRFLESLLSIAMSMGKGDKTKEERENKRAKIEKQSQRKAKITGKTYFEGKIQNTEPESSTLKNEKAKSPTISTRPRTSVEDYSKSKVAFKELISTKPARDTAKSEVQIPPIKGSSGEGSKMKSEKNMSLSKPDTDETRKKRKNRNKVMKNGSEEFVEASFPSEVSKVADVKELWRRDAREKSDNSLSSYSSCTVPEGDEVPEWKNLGIQSYKILKKLVEEEVTKITPKSAKKDNTVEVENKENASKTEDSKETGKPKNNTNKLKAPQVENTENLRKGSEKKENEVPNAPPEQNQAKKRQHYSVYEGKKQKSQPPSAPPEETDKGTKQKLQLIDEIGKNMHKVPSLVEKEWSIINRLEQAFLVLGTPNFNDKGKDSSVVENQNSNQIKKSNPGPEKLNGSIHKRVMKLRSKDILGRKKNKETRSVIKNATPKTPEDSSLNFTTSTLPRKKIKLDSKLSTVKEKPQKSKPEKEVRNDSAPSPPKTPNISNITGDEENKLKQKERRTPRNTPDGHVRRSTTSKSTEKLKANVTEPRHTKKETKGLKNTECITPPEQANPQEVKHNKTSKITAKAIKLHHEKKLERKKTFNVIHMKERRGIHPRKSKSCNKIEENYDRDGVKFSFSQTKTRENRSVKKELIRRMEKETPKRILKKTGKSYSMKEKSLPSDEKPKSREKDFPRANREGVVKNPKTRAVQEKKAEKSCPMEELSQQIMPKKEVNNNSKKRAIKERSILSMRLNQQDAQEQVEILPEIQEKLDSIIPVLTEAKTPEAYGALEECDASEECDVSVVYDAPDVYEAPNIYEAPDAFDVPDVYDASDVYDVPEAYGVSEAYGASEEQYAPEVFEHKEMLCVEETGTQVDSNNLQQNFLRKYSNISCISTSNFNLIASKPQNTCTETRLRLIIREFQDDGVVEDPDVVLSASSLSNHVFGKRQGAVMGTEQTDLNPSKNQQLWEQDMNYYHSIVREIMSHYKRIDGLLKQSEQCDELTSSLLNLSSKNFDPDEESTVLRNDLHSLQEYRKKVMYEYQALPFCEYKSQMQQKKEESTKSEDGRKRNLQVVKDIKTGTDLDVKDFRLNIQKVLDSQLYVDADLLVKRNESLLKFKEIPLCKSENTIKY